MSDSKKMAWYEGISRYQWLVLIVACLGWIFDIFEGQIFVASMSEVIPSLTGLDMEHPDVSKWNDWAFAAFAFGGAFGGILFGMLSDKIGRSKTMIITILFYSIFTLFQAFVQNPEQLMILRFFVAMGVGGEWAVASAMVAEVMPKRSRAITSSIFHASSVIGTLLAVAAGFFIVGNEALGWRWGFAIGVLPAFLTLWIRWKLKEPEQWKAAKAAAGKDKSKATGKISDLFNKEHLRNTLVGVSLAAVGLITFWGSHIYGKNALMSLAKNEAEIAEAATIGTKPDVANKTPEEVVALMKPYNERKRAAYKKHDVKKAEMVSMGLNTIGAGFGLVLFGWFAGKMGRKGAFVFYHAFAFVMAIVLFKYLIPNGASATVLACVLPVFGFFTVGMHAGYAVYFPELFPTRLRGTGAGVCFNGARIFQGLVFFGIGALGLANADKAFYLAWLYPVGILVVLFAKETRGEELPD